jgi:hypothetical protein
MSARWRREGLGGGSVFWLGAVVYIAPGKSSNLPLIQNAVPDFGPPRARCFCGSDLSDPVGILSEIAMKLLFTCFFALDWTPWLICMPSQRKIGARK